ncbi:hypothetical protein [Altererythrobacter sp. GH1-8]|uniref:hypothetical protein n=1 Tax=Altererythrobacter sp. GH1-8 TaxID=3349333 RepID=UPI00374DD42F
MGRIVLGVFVGLLMAGVGLSWWQTRAQVEANAPPPPAALTPSDPSVLPITDPADMTGPTPPEASDLTREQRRFFRYDRNRDLVITRNEMLSTRSDAFRKLDKDGNNLLTFEEWAVTTVERFEGADGNSDGKLTQREFATTARPSTPTTRKPSCEC